MFSSDFLLLIKNPLQSYTCELRKELDFCLKNNIHNRSKHDIQMAIDSWEAAPSHFIQLDYQALIDEFNNSQTTKTIELDVISDDDGVDDDDNFVSLRYGKARCARHSNFRLSI